MKISIQDIKVGNRKRVANKQKVQDIAQSIKTLGLLNPITVTPKLELVAGLHRLEACRMLGLKKIDAVVKDFNRLKHELAEIDENLIRHELSIMEQGEMLLQRDQILEAMHLRAKNGRPKKGENNSPFLTTAKMAREVGISERVAQQRKQIARSISPDVKDKLRGTVYANNAHGLMQLARQPLPLQRLAVKKILSHEASRAIKIDVNEPNVIKMAIQMAHRDFNIKKWQNKLKTFDLPDSITLNNGDFRKICQEMESETVDLCLTDPLWNKEGVNDFKDLGKAVMRVLKPSAFFICYIGIMYHPQIVNNLLESGLQYWWMGICRFSKGRNTLYYRNVWSYKRHFLIMRKPPINKKSKFFMDVLDSHQKEKDYHKYQQAIDDFKYLISRFSSVGDTVLDPCMGGGTTVMACLSEKRRCIGIDIDPKAVIATKARIAEHMKNGQ